MIKQANKGDIPVIEEILLDAVAKQGFYMHRRENLF